MRHRIAKKTLSRTSAHRKSLIRNLSENIILSEKVETTIDKAKFVRPYIEKLITKAIKAHKQDKIFIFNTVKYLKTKLFTNSAVEKLVNDIAPRYLQRNGGYTKITRTGNRPGDNSMKAKIELIQNENSLTKATDKDKLILKANKK